MARRRHPIFLPFNLYDAFPWRDLLDMPPPTPLWTWLELQHYAASCGDGLFLFLATELSDDEIDSQYNHIRTVVSDCLKVRHSIEDLLE